MKLFSGVLTALITPLKNNRLDETSLRNLVEWQIENGIHGLIPCGTTGESSTLSLEEKKEVIKVVIDQTQKRVPVIAGTGTNNTQESIELTQWAKKAGADAALVVTPYYNKPTQEGLYQHYFELSKIGLPLILYNVPSRTSLSLTLDTLIRLSLIDNIAAIKEATGSLDFGTQIVKETHLMLLSGDDFTFLPLLSIGGEGVISVVSNVIPKEFSNLYRFFEDGDLKRAQDIHLKYYSLMQALFVETNPIPVKTALHLMKKIPLEFRLPLCELSPQNQKQLEKTLQKLELI